MLGFSTDPGSVRERATEYAERGFPAQKWFLRHGPGSGEDGKDANVAMAQAAREATGASYDLMFDRLAPLDPRWLEQPLDKQRVDGYAALVREAPFPVAGGEHGATRWDFARLIEARALDVLQPEPFYTGGITETDRASAPPSTTRSSSPRPNWRDRSGVRWSPWGFIQPAVAACRQFAGESGPFRD